MPPSLSPPEPRLTRRVILAATALATLLFRYHLAFRDLPYFAEEALPFRQAVTLWGWARDNPTLNPHFFNYPSLSIYLHAGIQFLVGLAGLVTGRYRVPADAALDLFLNPGHFVVPARLVGIAADCATSILVAVWASRYSRLSGITAGLLYAAMPTAILSATHIVVDSLLALATTAATYSMARYARERRDSLLLGSAALIGLACGIKYSAVVLIPCLVYVWTITSERREIRGLLLSLCVIVVVFVVTTPFAVLDFTQFRYDTGYELMHLASGHFGTPAHPVMPLLSSLLRNLGPFGIVLAPAAVVRWPSASSDRRVLLGLVFALGVPLFLAHTFTDRYLLPLLPLLAMLAGVLAATTKPRSFPYSRAIFVAGLVLPLFVFGARLSLGSNDSVAGAMEWCAGHLTPQDVVVQEFGALPVVTMAGKESVLRSFAFTSASQRWRSPVEAAMTWPVLDVPFFASGVLALPDSLPSRNDRLIPLVAHGWQANGVAYTRPILDVATFYVSTSSIRSRFAKQPTLWREPIAWYAYLHDNANDSVCFRAGNDSDEPSITIYRLPDIPRGDAAWPRPDWWLKAVTPQAKELLDVEDSPGPSLQSESSLRSRAFSMIIGDFLRALAVANWNASRMGAAHALSVAILREDATDDFAVRLFIATTLENDVRHLNTASTLRDSLRMVGADSMVVEAELRRLRLSR